MISPAGLSLLWLQWEFATNIRHLMDAKVDPCVNFYDFACGNYKHAVKLPDDKASMGRFTEVDDDMKKMLRTLLEAPDQFDDPVSTSIAKKFYRSCTDERKLEQLGIKPLQELLEQYGGWPVVKGDAWKEKDYDWMTMNARLLTQLGGSDILNFYINSDLKNSTKKTLFIDQVSLGLGKREFYLDKKNKKFLDAYFEYMVATAVQLGASSATARTELQKALDFEIALANASVRDEDRRDNNAIHHPMTIKELKAKYPKVNFDAWFKTAADAGFNFKDTDVINLSGLPFLEKLPGLLPHYSPRTLANFQIWSEAASLVSSLAPSLRENYRRFTETMTGTPKFKPRWQECVDATSSKMKLPVGALYVKKFFSQKAKEQVDDMVLNIRAAMKSTINSIKWMDETTKRSAQEKLEAMIQNIAYPSPDIYNETWVMRDHTMALIKEDAYLENIVQLAFSTMNREMREFRVPVNRTEWIGGIAEVNAWYNFDLNKMTFPAGILRFSFFHPDAPDYFNYGHIGSVMGHELTHGFDDQGRQYDKLGNFELWWSNATLHEFTKGAKCFIEQYGSIIDPTTKKNLNGENTQGENIADNGGVKLAYKAYRDARLARSDERNRILPDLSEYTADQLFFVSYAQTWCTISRTPALEKQIVSDVHSPSQYRVNVPLQNNQEFAAAYKCPTGSPMNPRKKCQIW